MGFQQDLTEIEAPQQATPGDRGRGRGRRGGGDGRQRAAAGAGRGGRR